MQENISRLTFWVVCQNNFSSFGPLYNSKNTLSKLMPLPQSMYNGIISIFQEMIFSIYVLGHMHKKPHLILRFPFVSKRYVLRQKCILYKRFRMTKDIQCTKNIMFIWTCKHVGACYSQNVSTGIRYARLDWNSQIMYKTTFSTHMVTILFIILYIYIYLELFNPFLP